MIRKLNSRQYWADTWSSEPRIQRNNDLRLLLQRCRVVISCAIAVPWCATAAPGAPHTVEKVVRFSILSRTRSQLFEAELAVHYPFTNARDAAKTFVVSPEISVHFITR